jgi:ribose transport system ATP-binding protein
MTSLDQPVAELSGGNQQKVALGRAWLAGFEVLLLDEPTRGIDVGARSSIYELIAHRAARGTAFVVASSDLRELVTISDRVAIFRRGRLMETLEGEELDYEHVAAACIEATP